ncbi:MAG: carbon-nitrogen hydrolase family protein [Candidatus Latescibacteria bacterium]|nr:carbon-nitrogen hydrolase family protein [Candidatus Latescibacterota bacterium]
MTEQGLDLTDQPDRWLKLGLGQMLVEGGEPERNLQRARQMIDKAAQESCQVVLLPECLDLAWTHPSARHEAEPVPGPRSQELCDAAEETGLYVCAGLTELEGDRVYNCAIVVDPAGEIVLKYRKINVLGIAQEFYSIGGMLGVVDTPFGLIGVDICSDNYVDGLAIGHTLARMGACLILSPSSWTVDYSVSDTDDPYGDKWLRPYYTLASLYDLVVAGCTSVGVIIGGPYEGKKMVGSSLVVDRDGPIMTGEINEVAGRLTTVDVPLRRRTVYGTEIGQALSERGHEFGTVDPPMLTNRRMMR